MALSQAHKADIALFEQKTGELKSYLTEHADKHTAATIQHAGGLRDEVTAVKGRLVNHAAAAGFAGEADGFDAFLNGSANGIKHIGSAKSGETEIDADGSVLSTTGAGLVSAKAWDAMKDPAYKKAFREYLKKGERMSSAAYKTLEVGLDQQGGYLAPPDMISRLIERKPTPTRVAGMVETITTSADATIMSRVPYAGASDDPNVQIYSTGFRTTWTEENPTSDEQSLVNDASLFGTTRIDNFTNMIEGTLTNNQVEDASFDPMAWMEGKFNETIDILADDAIINGTSIQQPMGILPYALQAGSDLPVLTTSVSGGIAADDIVDMTMDVPEQYEENLGFLFNKTGALRYLRKLKDANSRYLWGQGYQDSGLAVGRQADLAGYKYTLSGLMRDMPSGAPSVYATGKTPVIFGDLKGYTRTVRVGFSIQVCRELLARRNKILLIGRVRFGGKPVEPWRLRVLKIKA